ncbi:MAG TPA: hypothetical protein VG389_01465 [Myxococcota bacterium]|nr:hypothetical protein [Myxococcota bacterium]
MAFPASGAPATDAAAGPRRATALAAAVVTAATAAWGGAGCPRRGHDTPHPDAALDAGVDDAPAPAVHPPGWRNVAPLGKAPLELAGALIPHGADALIAGEPGETVVYALKRDYALSALFHVEFSSPASPTLGPPLVLRGPSSEATRVGRYLAFAVAEAGRPPELLLVRGGAPPRVIGRARLDAPMLGPIAVAGDVVYVATAAAIEGLPEPPDPHLLAFRATPGEGAGAAAEVEGALEPLGSVPLPAPARALAVVGRRLVVATGAPDPVLVLPLDDAGRPAPRGSTLGYRVVQKLAFREYAFAAAPRALCAAGPDLALASDPHTTFVALRLDPTPHLSFAPPFTHSKGGGLLAVETVPGGAARLYRLRGQRLFVDALDAAGRPTPLARLRLGLGGSGRALALVPGLVLAADDAFGLYLFPR